MNSVLSILSADGSAGALPDCAFRKFAEFLGVSTRLIPVSASDSIAPDALAPQPGSNVLALSRATLRRLMTQPWFERRLDEARATFVYDCMPDGSAPTDLAWLTDGALSGMAPLPRGKLRVAVSRGGRFAHFPVAGKSYPLENAELSAFVRSGCSSAIESCLSADGHPLFVAVVRRKTTVFLLAGPPLVDINATVPANTSLRPWYAQLVAASLFLRATFGSACWSSPVTGATFIVDDPYLKHRYGFIHYETLVRQLEAARSAMTVAFIPYNYRRSSPDTVSLLRNHAHRFSIAVHGCDHTGGEFASADPEWLAGTAACAMERMTAHTARTAMPCDNVMIFPQGRFSTKAISALKACGFDAAVNSTAWPEDHANATLTVRDLLQVAVTRFDNFPLFVRRYPGEIFDHAFDVLFQKPVLAVEHHGYFREGYEAFADFVRDVSTLHPKLSWGPLGRTLASTCVIQQTSSDAYRVRHFLPVLRLANPTSSTVALTLEKQDDADRIESITVGGGPVSFVGESGIVRYTTTLRAHEELNVTIAFRKSPQPSRRPTLKYRFDASARRLLSDARDNYLARSETILSAAETIKALLIRRRGSRKQAA